MNIQLLTILENSALGPLLISRFLMQGQSAVGNSSNFATSLFAHPIGDYHYFFLTLMEW